MGSPKIPLKHQEISPTLPLASDIIFEKEKYNESSDLYKNKDVTYNVTDLHFLPSTESGMSKQNPETKSGNVIITSMYIIKPIQTSTIGTDNDLMYSNSGRSNLVDTNEKTEKDLYDFPEYDDVRIILRYYFTSTKAQALLHESSKALSGTLLCTSSIQEFMYDMIFAILFFP